MDLWIVRHAIAEERRPGLAEGERELTGRGVKRFEACVRGLDRLGVRFERVLTSPWTRAAHTAALLAPLRATHPPSTEPTEPESTELLLGDPAPALLDAIAAGGADRVAVVGHEPWLSELLAWLVTGEAEDGDARFRLKKGGAAHLRGAPKPGRMQLRALLPPKALIAMGG